MGKNDVVGLYLNFEAVIIGVNGLHCKYLKGIKGFLKGYERKGISVYRFCMLTGFAGSFIFFLLFNVQDYVIKRNLRGKSINKKGNPCKRKRESLLQGKIAKIAKQ